MGEAASGQEYGLVWAAPFAGLLLSVALGPLLAPGLWRRLYLAVAGFWTLAVLLPVAAVDGWEAGVQMALAALIRDYLPFIAPLGALFVVAGGIRLTGRLRGTPAVNTLLLLAGTAAASLIGTTGAALLVIRPLIRANRRRRHSRHVFVFCILLVANVGGALLPLGDPPMLLGFLNGVPFFWPTGHLAGPTLLLGGVLLGAFYLLDRHHHRRAPDGDPAALGEIGKLGLQGKRNLVLLPLVPLVVVLAGTAPPGRAVMLAGLAVARNQLVMVGLLLGVAALSLRWTPPSIRRANEFTWAAMVEVAVLFAAIFVTIEPVLAMLRHGTGGALLAFLNPGGVPDGPLYFWGAGLLAAVLDNAPTYLLFFNAAGGDAAQLVQGRAATLIAISAGAVYFGALTYIGNAPNFMIRTLAEENGIAMPGFFAYAGWAAGLMLPPLAVIAWIFL